MKTITKEFPRKNIYPIETLTGEYTPVLFDIETTGLKAETSYLYLIGAMEIKRDRLLFYQWFAEKPSEETELLNSFLAWLPDRTCLIHFNGRGFDVPYLTKKCRQRGIPSRLSQMPNIDLYRSFSPLKEYFNMTSRRLVAYERLIGLEREDCYNGGELIDVYKEYIGKSKFDAAGSEQLLHMLLLHNEEDIRDMAPVLGLFTYMDLMSGNFAACEITLPETKDAEHKDAGNQDAEHKESGNKFLTLTLKFDHEFPLGYSKSFATMPGLGHITVNTSGNTAVITVPLIETRLRHYYEDYRNYFYLPAEDTAIHKSVASSVDPKHRIAAVKATAYTYAKGQFLPQKGTAIKPNFKYELTDAVSFIPLNSLKNDESIKTYLKAIF